jgi:hypothetical protein
VFEASALQETVLQETVGIAKFVEQDDEEIPE